MSTTYDAVKARAICERLENEPNLGLREILRQAGVPKSTFHGWRKEHPELEEVYLESKHDGFDNLAVQCLDIIDTPPERIATEHGDKVDPGYVAWQKSRAEERRKLLAKWWPDKYGDRTVLAGDPNAPLRSISDEELDARIAAFAENAQPK